MYDFSVDRIWPCGEAKVWGAQFTYTTPNERVGNSEIAHNLTLKVRFYYDGEDSVNGLLDVAYAKARELAAQFATSSGEASLSDMLAKAGVNL